VDVDCAAAHLLGPSPVVVVVYHPDGLVSDGPEELGVDDLVVGFGKLPREGHSRVILASRVVIHLEPG
jgi:hypothetical protein